MSTSTSTELAQFAADVLSGLTSDPKRLSSRYFYDDEGSRLFVEIMELPEYYLTRAEFDLFNSRRDEIIDAFTAGVDAVDIVELGAGDGAKTAVLIEGMIERGIDFTYQPIDISDEANSLLMRRFTDRFPTLTIRPHTGDYFKVLETLRSSTDRRKVILFLGSNIGNFQSDAALAFFRDIRNVMNADDRLFVGFDLQKDPRLIVAAYDDPQGVTAAFNLNLLIRINRELGANFDVSKFSHYAQYRPIECAARSFLISREDQDVHIAALGRTFHFDQWEAIFMEISQKYTCPMIESLADESDFEIVDNFVNDKDFYLDSLWKPGPTARS